MRRALLIVLFALGAGPARAGSDAVVTPAPAVAWVAQYTVHDAAGDRTLVLVRGDDRVEYRLAGEPIRVWRQGADGLVHHEVFVDAGRVVTYAPGDLRALGRHPQWSQLSHLVDPTLRAKLASRGTVHVQAAHGADAQRYRGDVGGIPVAMEWLDAADLPATYRSGEGKAAYRLELRALEQRPVAQAFTAFDGLREIDYADIGDMELDPFARQYIREGAGVAAGH
ncbi:hypothetical protein [Lysobacter fragariae]